MNGFLPVFKPKGMTSNDIVLYVRKKIPHGIKIGHAGTLDPEAEGVLPLMIGKATRLFDYINNKEKTYVAECILGIETDTQDITGNVINKGRNDFSRIEIEHVLSKFKGDILQTPPMFSALKKNGKRLYDLARQGIVIERSPRPIRIYSLDVSEIRDSLCVLTIICSKGTYIRTLCHDIGIELGSFACMGKLLRTKCCGFSIDDAIQLESIDRCDEITSLLRPIDYPLMFLKKTEIIQSNLKSVKSGKALTENEVDVFPREGQIARLYYKNVFCGIGKRVGNSIQFQCMLME